MIPDSLLPHSVTLVRPVTSTDDYGNTTYAYGAGATRTVIKAWLQQDRRAEVRREGREALEQIWLLVTNHEDALGRDRIEFGSTVFEVDGPPEPAYTPAGFHHTEATLRVIAG